ncbi:hypothetical protein Tco_0817499, partial [Tanacetum coccineum]
EGVMGMMVVRGDGAAVGGCWRLWWFRLAAAGSGGDEMGDEGKMVSAVVVLMAVVGRLGTRRSNKVVAWRRVGWWIG